MGMWGIICWSRADHEDSIRIEAMKGQVPEPGLHVLHPGAYAEGSVSDTNKVRAISLLFQL